MPLDRIQVQASDAIRTAVKANNELWENIADTLDDHAENPWQAPGIPMLRTIVRFFFETYPLQNRKGGLRQIISQLGPENLRELSEILHNDVENKTCDGVFSIGIATQ